MAVPSHIFAYCERATDPAFWAEPLNAVSNAGFILAALWALRCWGQRRGEGAAELALIGLVGLIGIGSFIFHTLATPAAMAADVVPIGVFMVAYTAYALRRFLGWPAYLTAGGVAAFLTLVAIAPMLPCPQSMRTAGFGGRCLDGSVSYIPAWIVLATVTAALIERRHPAAALLSAATLAFALALVARSLDQMVCPATLVWGRPRGTHALWHLLNALTLTWLLMAAVRHGRPAGRPVT